MSEEGLVSCVGSGGLISTVKYFIELQPRRRFYPGAGFLEAEKISSQEAQREGVRVDLEGSLLP